MRRNAHEVLCEKKSSIQTDVQYILDFVKKKKKKKQVHKEMTRRKCTKL